MSEAILRLRLYVAGSAPNSARARANLNAILSDLPPESVQLEIIDVLHEPLRALEDGVFVTPMLWKMAPPPASKIIGDLSDLDQVRQPLGLGKGMA